MDNLFASNEIITALAGAKEAKIIMTASAEAVKDKEAAAANSTTVTVGDTTVVTNVTTDAAAAQTTDATAVQSVDTEAAEGADAAETTADTALPEEAATDTAATETAVPEETTADEAVTGDTAVDSGVIEGEAAVTDDAIAKEAAGAAADGTYVDPGVTEGMYTEEGMPMDPGAVNVKDPILSSWPFVIGISAAVLFVSVVLGILMAKHKIKKGIELYED